MCQIGLLNNEIPVARTLVLGMQGALYEMLVTWLNKTRQGGLNQHPPGQNPGTPSRFQKVHL